MASHVMSPKELTEYQQRLWLLVEPGFVVETGAVYHPGGKKFFLTKEKNEQDETLTVIPLTQENVLMLLDGVVPSLGVMQKNDLLNVYPTVVTKAMCREREGLSSYCSSCKSKVYKWKTTRNYRVGADGLCQHIDCSFPSTQEPLP